MSRAVLAAVALLAMVAGAGACADSEPVYEPTIAWEDGSAIDCGHSMVFDPDGGSWVPASERALSLHC